MADDRNARLVRAFLAAWERRDTAHIAEAFTEDGVYHSTPLAPIVGREAIREWVASFEGKPSGRLNVVHQVVSGDVVVNERVDEITLNGKPIALPICGVFELRGGRIAAWREYFDLGPVRAAYDD